MFGVALIIWIITFFFCIQYKGGIGDFALFFLAGGFFSTLLGVALSYFVDFGKSGNGDMPFASLAPVFQSITLVFSIVGGLCAIAAFREKNKAEERA